MSTFASCFSWLMATRFAAVPAGVAMPPMSGPKAVAIISARPKLLRPVSSFASRSRPTPSGSSMAATAMSVIHHEMNVPTASTPRAPGRFAFRRARDLVDEPGPSPERVNAAESISTPMKNINDRIAEAGAHHGAKIGDAERGISSTTSSEVTANGSVSVTHASRRTP